MALSGLDIYKLLPVSSKNAEVKKHANCKECGFPTCLAFAMKLAQKQADLAQCPYVEDAAKTQLAASAAPPIRLVTLTAGERKLAVGQETAMFRHEKTFFNPPGLFIRIKDTQADAVEIAQTVAAYKVDYVGMSLTLDGLAVEASGGDFAATVAAIRQTAPSLLLILLASDPAAAEAGLKAAGDARPMLWAATAANAVEMAKLAASYKVPLAARADNGDINALAGLVEQVKASGVEDIVLDPDVNGYRSLAAFIQLRRLAVKKNERRVGYPLLALAGDDPVLAGQHIAKYAGFIIIDRFDPSLVYPLLVLRANIYADPQKPIQVKPGLYDINQPGSDAPLMVTTNFSITYFAVANEIESSGRPGWLLVTDAEGMSVLTAWAAGKFDAARIAKAVQTTGAADKVSHKRLIIPGQVAVLLGQLEEALPGWEIKVGPREAVDLPNYLKQQVTG